MQKPNFFIVGAARSGTTSLANYLSEHPDIFVSQIKEPKFFSQEENEFPHNGHGDDEVDKRVVKSIVEYELLFKDGHGCAAIGEASVDYLYFSNVSQRIKEYNSDAKIIIILRNPVERAFSAYNYLLRSNREDLDFISALDAEMERKSKNWEFFWYYKEVGLYFEQVKRYIDCFGEENIKIILFDDFVNNTNAIIQELFVFLGVSKNITINFKKLNMSGIPKWKWLDNTINTNNTLKSIIKPILPNWFCRQVNEGIAKANLVDAVMGGRAREILLFEYKSDLINLHKLIKRDLSHWLKP